MKMRVGPIFSRRTIFSNKTGQGTDIFSEHFGPRTVISGTKFPVTGPLQSREATCLLIQAIFLSDVHFSDFVTLRNVRSTYCACAMIGQ